jgi:predicted nucleic acid-binding protein
MIVSSVGILIRAKQMKLIPSVRPLLEEMVQRGVVTVEKV